MQPRVQHPVNIDSSVSPHANTTCVSAFICHHNSFLMYSSLERPTLSVWLRVTHVSVGVAAALSGAFAVAGYITFTGHTQGSTNVHV